MALHDEHRGTRRPQSIEPRGEQLVELGLADSDRRVRPDQVEAQLLVDIRRRVDVDIAQSVANGVPCAQVAGALVDIDSEHPSGWRPASQREGDRPGAATEVEEVASGRRCRRLAEQQLGTRVETPVTEHTAVGAQHEWRLDEVVTEISR